jgi:tRNA A-37 threonylcarbamoyl transferase component Bud32
MSEASHCPQCRAALRPDAPEGLCPECLLKEVMKTGSELGHEANATATRAFGSNPPSLEELAKQFPQLEILELLGQGGMGIVYKARHPRLDRFMALKILPTEAGGDSAFAERFAREARALAKLTHPSIVAVYDFGESDGRFYLLMEFVDGVNLRYLLRERRLKPEEALKIVPQICEALQYAHDEGVVHRDIKPENILLDKKGHVKIADFGLAKLLGPKTADSALTGSQQIMGTPHYMAPEQMERPLAVDHRADIYSLGVVFYEMLTGELPLGRFAPPSQKVEVDVRLDEVILRSLEKEPERRYQHASEVSTAVEALKKEPAFVHDGRQRQTACDASGKKSAASTSSKSPTPEPEQLGRQTRIEAVWGGGCFGVCLGVIGGAIVGIIQGMVTDQPPLHWMASAFVGAFVGLPAGLLFGACYVGYLMSKRDAKTHTVEPDTVSQPWRPAAPSDQSTPPQP